MHTKSSNLKQRVNFYTNVKLKDKKKAELVLSLVILSTIWACAPPGFPLPKTKIHWDKSQSSLEDKAHWYDIAMLGAYQLLNIPTSTGINVCSNNSHQYGTNI
jgi:hypothetical protein